ncbi:glycoside hydrolase family 15 protein [Nocardiopsis sp. L17-MgMaSL7]|uniref:glycoside hydrolase family 15 protein n=1 Tax=Nocardiopsis sp. L17-MgMaSL7 TaxID=1938893 RepID=UPI000D70911C|nr:glycoside hydrolase family 15 protein [Nocardiopsis sp. L17-MgMaSL7]PWV55417.1 GH15 family glucan-1,4-alpha-glucosidase [Nocardiopsis sp. L17-MgMaSL7]
MVREETTIGAHGFLSDCHTAALTSPEGAITWLCTPRFDGPAFLSGVLDPDVGGEWTMEVQDARPVARSYMNDSLVLETLWRGSDIEVVVRDLLALGRGADGRGLLREGLLVRLVECRSGTTAVRSRLCARPRFGTARASWEAVEGGLREASGPLLSGVPSPTLNTSGDPEFHVELAEGETAVFALDYLGGERRLLPGQGHSLLRETLEAWGAWAARTHYDGVGAAQVRRSALVLRGLLHEESGALIAAPTTSLPEWPQGPRNWDYRYVWHRDAALVVLTFLRLGHEEEAGSYLRYLLGVCGQPVGWVAPVHTVDGRQPPGERTLDHLAGHGGARPVRVGNAAFSQHQLDVYGHVLDAAHCFEAAGGGLERHELRQLDAMVEAVRDLWREPDDGVWEIRSESRHWTNSKVYAWVCLDRAVQLAEATGRADEVPLGEWREEARAVREQVIEHGRDPDTGSFVQSYGSTNVDGALLRIPLLGFLHGRDPRVLRTLERVDAELGHGGWLVHRYDPEETDDGIGTPEGAFLLCSFDLVSALVLAGHHTEASRRFHRLCESAGDLGLLSEAMASDGTQLGNFPQAFTHLALIEAAVNLDGSDDREALHAWARNRSRNRNGPAGWE